MRYFDEKAKKDPKIEKGFSNFTASSGLYVYFTKPTLAYGAGLSYFGSPSLFL